MKTLGFQTAEELVNYFNDVGAGVLFRGQTKEYFGADSRPSLSTSFSRKGCIPPRMLKWSHYAKTILRSFVKNFDDQPDLATDQAILQHYGWRSFFLDATASAAVASWFAGHDCTAQRCINLAEDCFEDPANLIHDRTSHTAAEGTGVVYVISKKALRANNIQAVDLAEIITADGHPRYIAQSAWMVGPLDRELPPDCIVAKVLAPTRAFLDFAHRGGQGSQADLFPGPADDPVLSALLSVPWVYRPVEGDEDPFTLLFYERGLPLPEYGWKPVKRHRAEVAFYRPFWIANEFGPHAPFCDAAYLMTPEPVFFGSSNGADCRIPNLVELLREKSPLIIEMDGLIAFPNLRGAHYGKGLLVSLREENVLSLEKIQVTHPGRRVTGYSYSAGRSYAIGADSTLTRKEQSDDCPCGIDGLHEEDLTVAIRVDELLKEGRYRNVRPHVYACDDINPDANLCHLKDETEKSVPYFAIDMQAA